MATFPRPRFQAKLLIPIFAVMVSLILATLWVVNSRISNQVQAEAAKTLATADAVFRNNQRIRERNLLLRYGSLANEPRYKAISRLVEGKTVRDRDEVRTMQEFLRDVLKELGVAVVQFSTPDGRPFATITADGSTRTEDFAANALAVVQQSLQGEATVDTIVIRDQRAGADDQATRLLDVVAIPVRVGSNIVGALTIGSECGNSVANEFHQLTRSEVVFFARDRITATTLNQPAWNQQCIHAYRAGKANPIPQVLELGSEHFLTLRGRFQAIDANNPLGYLLLVSYEPSLMALKETQRTLLGLGLIGLFASVSLTWLVVRKVTQPLRELRNVAEAVGRGDFTRRIDIASKDECGELAGTFNRMTHNLSTARDQLESTVDTLNTTRAQLTQSEKLSAIGEFVAGVAHELNNPLTTVIGYAELLQRAQVDERYRRQLATMEREAQRCHRIVQSLLTFSRRHKPERKLIQLNDVIRSAVDILAYQMRTSNIDLQLQLAAHLPLVVADSHQLQQVIVNILNNARQAIGEVRSGGWIRVTTALAGERLRLTLQDNGPGIPPENLSRIFEPFFTTKDVGQGTGLGLSLCYGIIEEHGGTFRADSAVGAGATFEIELPIAALGTAAVTSPTVPASVPAAQLDGDGKRVLVIDDEPTIGELIRHVLLEAGYAVEVVNDGARAVERATAQKFDLILCDLKMPGLNGRDVYERLVAATPAIAPRFIFMTGDVINEHTQAFLQQQGRHCLSKPFSLENIRRIIKDAFV